MKIALLSILMFICLGAIGQTEIIKLKPVDTLKLYTIKKLLILEPIVPFDNQIIKYTIRSAIIEEIDTILDFHFIENDEYVSKSQNSINIKIKEIIKSLNDCDAILITVYSNDVIYDYSIRGMFIPFSPYPVTDNISNIQMFLIDKYGEIIRKRRKSAWSADRFGLTKNPIRIIKDITKLSTYAMIKKIMHINEACSNITYETNK